ncbi:MAG: flagellar basal body rod protein FlgC [Alphaproteobacteria bacterium]|nr:flagellar basal body rod protein FlgC [Alphaproteobacteria bacterium]MDD9919422.1 flagellar basal body rod protein FlgC [Alphaproteobacteria bacterium]
MDLLKAMDVSAGGMAAQSARVKMIAENIANADSVITDEGTAYRRKQIQFKADLDKASGLTHVHIDRIIEDDKTPFRKVYEPSHPAANDQGFVLYPNVDTMVETVDLREATRMYEANMQAIESAKEMMARSMDLLR